MTADQVAQALHVAPAMAKRAMKVLDVLGVGELDDLEEPWQHGRLRLRPEWWPCL